MAEVESNAEQTASLKTHIVKSICRPDRTSEDEMNADITKILFQGIFVLPDCLAVVVVYPIHHRRGSDESSVQRMPYGGQQRTVFFYYLLRFLHRQCRH